MTDPIQRYREILGLTENQYLDYKYQGQLIPAIAKDLDQSFLLAAQKANISADEFKDIFKGSPYIQNLIDIKASSFGIDAYSLGMEAKYRNMELQSIQASVANSIKKTAKTTYKYVAYAEKALFAVTPLPMNAIKSGVQNVVIPATATFALSNPRCLRCRDFCDSLGGKFYGKRHPCDRRNCLGPIHSCSGVHAARGCK
jgi:hypothetical protein